MMCCFRAVRSVVSLTANSQRPPFAILAGSAPISVSGIGTRDGTILLLGSVEAARELLSNSHRQLRRDLGGGPRSVQLGLEGWPGRKELVGK